MKKYNIYELRFLQILVSKEQHDLIMLDQFFIRTEETLWRGNDINNKEKGELLIEAGNLLELSASGDYLAAIKAATKSIKAATKSLKEVGFVKDYRAYITDLTPIKIKKEDKDEKD